MLGWVSGVEVAGHKDRHLLGLNDCELALRLRIFLNHLASITRTDSITINPSLGAPHSPSGIEVSHSQPQQHRGEPLTF